jgi:hypothetical protein
MYASACIVLVKVTIKNRSKEQQQRVVLVVVVKAQSLMLITSCAVLQRDVVLYFILEDYNWRLSLIPHLSADIDVVIQYAHKISG